MKPEEFRDLFSQFIRSEDQESSFVSSDILSEVEDAGTKGASFIAQILPGGKLDLHSSLKVYREAYQARFTEALGDRFETVWKILGDEDFFELAKRYISSVPSLSYNLSDYGESFPEFIGENFPEHPFIREVADLELNISKIFHLPPNWNEELKNLPLSGEFNDLKFIFHESLMYLHYTHPVYELWKDQDEDFTPELPAKQDQYLMIGKRGENLWIQEIDFWEFQFGKNLSVGKTLLEAVEHSGKAPKGSGSISEFLSGLSQARFISEIMRL
ncbi:DUF2063 domain-containing protein [Leptospira langatensis]|uniref:DUF2063 domain-containing protein n=1 Tax=Leptospira langatensis TaxID=2484983 RepID=A0A5F1ZWS7_9LEPT|nr:DNA-binding domain-containing protein [Leptospira langatensis]TGK01250.1 DUF2063 domain-containing protein [Leptospira langatensis]TGL42298.1 DUF2063 domain-containing protein [Leptospira langatensis]